MEIDIDLAAKAIARDIFEVGDEPSSPVHRMQFIGGTYPDNEKTQGGVCEIALETLIKNSLKKQIVA